MTASADTPTVEFYWRPGCPFCMLLERSLKKKRIPFTKKNIWDDAAHAAVVRSLANGNETVPTVVVGSWFGVNPSAKDVVAAISTEAPELLC
ncbi:MAG: glutaredoxin domain-containing protein [Acidimicrobiales bacterium]